MTSVSRENRGQQGGAPAARPNARDDWDHAVMAAVLIGCKVYRLIVASDAVGAHGWNLALVWFYGIAADLLFVSAYALLGYGCLAIRPVGRFMVIPFRVATFVVSSLALGEHAFLRATGATLDWHILRYGVTHFVELLPIFLGFGWRKLAIGAAFLIGVALLPSAIASLGRQRWASDRPLFPRLRRTLRRYWRPLSLLSFAVVAQSCLVQASSPGDAPGFLVQNLHVRLGKAALGELWRDHSRVYRSVAIQDEEITETRSDRHYNVVLVVLESARARSFSAYGNLLGATPFFEELTKRGALVENAYTVAPHTTKALVSIQCGIYPRLDPEPYESFEKGIPVHCLPDLLRDAGYRSAFFQTAEENFERRKDLVREFGYDHFAGKQSLPSGGFDESNYLGFEDRAVLRPAMEWVDQQTNPILRTVLTLASQHPYAIPAGFEAQPFVADRSENDYVNTLAYTDRFLRELYGQFESRGLLENTIFVVMGDHGEAFGEHGVQQHDAVPYEEGLRVPMVLVGAPFKPGKRITGLRQHIDVVPTLLDAIGLRLEQSSRPGRSLLSTRGHERLYFACHYRDYCLAGRNARDKIVYHYDRRSPELFDLLVDPDERTNLSPQRSLEVSAWVDDLFKWKALVGAQFTEGRDWQITRDVSRQPPTVSQRLEVEFGSHIRLLGYDIERKDVPIGEQVTIAHHFFVTEKPDPSRAVVFHLFGPRSEDLTHPLVSGGYPLSRWKPGDYVTDRFTYFARPGTPHGDYRLMVGLWPNRHSSKGSAPVHARSDKAVLDQQFRVQTANFAVVAPPFEREEYVYSELPPDWSPEETMLTPQIGLVGCRLNKDRIKRGVRTALSCLYHAVRDNPVGRLCVTLQGPSTRTIVHTPVRGTYPTDEWSAGQYIRDELDLYLTTVDKDGDYRIKVGVDIDESGGARVPCSDGHPAVDVGALVLVP
jgi:arylsulfatase A-like enzyme